MLKRPVFSFEAEGYMPWGAMQDVYRSQASVRIVGGTYDAGKTFGGIAYMDAFAWKNPGARMTFVHRSLNRVYRNIVPSYEKFLGYKPTSRDDSNPTPVTRFGGERPEFFEYANGTRIYMNGLDKPQNLLSDFFDAGFVNQAELVPFDAWDELTARVSERAGTSPIAVLLGDCNPNVKHHWIRQQAKEKKLDYFRMSFLDNPEIIPDQQSPRLAEFKREFENAPDRKLIDKIADMFSDSGFRRVDKLRNLEGLRFKRGFLGTWGADEGLVFDGFDPEIHVVDISIMPNWRRYLSVDWGFRNPSSVIWWARSPDDRLYAYKEIYKPELTKPELIQLIKDNCDKRYDRIQYAAVDSEDQEGVEMLKRAGFRVNEPKKDRITQIQAVQERLKVDATGQPAIMFLRDRLVHAPDQNLKDDYKGTDVVDEFLSLTYSENMKGTRKDDQETVGEDHGTDSTAYLCTSLQAKQSIGSGRVVHGSVTMRR